jgi:hypothetical protein
MRTWHTLSLLILAGAVSLATGPQDWPMWGGTAHRNLTSAMKNLPESWDAKNGTNIKWKAQLGSSSNGNPVVADGRIFLGTNNGNPRNPAIVGDKGVLMCLRESDGTFLWQAVTGKLDGDSDWPEEGVCSSPAVEGKRLYYVSNRGELVCLDTEGFGGGRNDGPFQDEGYKGPTDADIIWKLDLRKELGVVQLFMAASSPVVWEDLVFVVTSNGRDSGDEKVIAPNAPSFLAVNKNTGKVVWQDNSPGENILHGQWGSASVGIVDGVAQAMFPGGDGWLYAFNARTGEKLWKFDLNRTGPGPSERCRPRVLHQARWKGRHHRVGTRLAVRPDPPVHFDRRGGRRAGLCRRHAGGPALCRRQDRETVLDVRHTGAGVGIAAGGRRQGLPGRPGRRCGRPQGRHGAEEDRRNRHGRFGLQHARARKRGALHHDKVRSLCDRRSGNREAVNALRDGAGPSGSGPPARRRRRADHVLNKGTVELRMRRSGAFHVQRFADDANRRW